MEISAQHVWLMISAAMVLLMTPGLGLFYGGMTRAKAALNMIMMSFISAGIVGVVWVLWGYSMTTGDGVLGLFGNPFANFGLQNLMGSPDLIKAGYSATFAIITVALISGAIADRAKFGAWALFVPIWITVVYCPLAYMVWGGGLMSAGGAVTAVFGQVIDFAGGAVVEISSGTAALVLALIVGQRHGFAKDPNHRPHNVPFIMLGAAILWFGWFGFNGGAATTAEQAGLIWVNTLVTPAAAMLSWLVTEKIRHGHPTSLGAASGVVAGLVAITPSCANISPLAAVGLGLVAGAACAVFVDLKYRFGLDDSLDVVGVHLGAGLIGTLALGFIALPADGQGGGLFYGGGIQQLIAQTAAVVITLLLSGLGTLVIGRAINKAIGFRVSHEAETAGVDLAEHAESAYAFGEIGAGFNPLPHAASPFHAAATAREIPAGSVSSKAERHSKEDSFA
ncbi:ammonium transporter [Arthrobacter sp. BB-1]|uniref:ammonium transporter n=1 Tax=Micrococcaceae TaxID=1268 RepID=UPI001111F086|nr:MULTISPECIES: ammonium transporter [Micrococcaceae]TNB69976.1 ammonium transporter [Arthrobacter sp. BB-1]UEL28031.1 ammonium transporter [Pseudarthrobacter sp. L1SW]